MSHLLEQLNPQQRAAVELTEGPVLILAGAGSGKTRVITYRIAYLIEARGVPPENILAVTFTNKAADQMKERVAALLGDPTLQTSVAGLASPTPAPRAAPHLSTFHSFCVRVLRRDIDRLGYSRDFSIYDDDDQLRLVKTALSELGLSDRILAPRAALARISGAKNRDISPEKLYQQARDPETERLASVFDLYEQKLRQANALDFDDLLLRTVELFEREGEVRDKYNRRFEYIHVDEYQDTNRIQYRLIRQLTRSHQNICAVGDEDQSIYCWRGASIENILNFERDFPGTRIIRLEQNYRSVQLILDAATAVVSRNLARKGKTLWTERSKGQRIGLFEARNADEEAAFVASRIPAALSEGTHATVGVLYRTNAQSRLLEEALRASGIKYRLVGGFSFYARAEVRDVLAYARLASNLRDSASFLRIVNVPSRGIGDTTVAGLEQKARALKLSLWEALEQETALGGDKPARALKALQGFHALMTELIADRQRLSMSQFFESILRRTRYLDVLQAENSPEADGRIENLRELVNAAAAADERGETLAEFLDHAALVSEADDYDERASVTLMTLHSAKGLEFSTVFLAGLEEGLFPHKLSGQAEADIEEERRLCYVGMTRAKDRLILSWAASRRSFGQESYGGTVPSRFLREIPPELVELIPRAGFAHIARIEGRSAKPRTSWENALNSRASVERALGERGAASAGSKRPGLSFGQPRSRDRWKLGDRVRHAKYGLGTVLEFEGEGDDTKLTVSFPGYGAKKLLERYASLEKA